MHMLAYGGYIPWMISFGTLYDVDVHGCCAWWEHFGTRCTWLIFLTYLLFHDVWYGTSLMHGQVQGSSLKEKLIYDPIENMGRHTHRGIHYSYDSRRKYLSYAYLEKRSILEEKS
jgi:hypothetical protein